MPRQKRHLRRSKRGKIFRAGSGLRKVDYVVVKRRDTGGEIGRGKFVRLTKDTIFIKEPEFGEIQEYDRRVFYVEKPSVWVR